ERRFVILYWFSRTDRPMTHPMASEQHPPGAPAVDLKRRRFLTAATSVVGGAGLALGAIPFLASFQPSDRARAIGGPVEIDVSRLEPGQRIVEMWRGQPVW